MEQILYIILIQINVEIPEIIPDEDGEYEDYVTQLSVKDINDILNTKKYKETIISMLNECIKDEDEELKEKIRIIIVGGGSRIPYIKKILNDYLKTINKKDEKILSTLNLDEAISCGCSYYGTKKEGLLHYEINDNIKPIQVGYDLENNSYKIISDENDENDKFNENDKIHLDKIINILNKLTEKKDKRDRLIKLLNDIEKKMYLLNYFQI